MSTDNNQTETPEEEVQETITLTLEDDSEMECTVLTFLELDDKNYVALLPIEEEEDEDGNVFLYEYVEKPDEEIELINIEDDDEFERVSEAFDEYMDSVEFDDVFNEEE